VAEKFDHSGAERFSPPEFLNLDTSATPFRVIRFYFKCHDRFQGATMSWQVGLSKVNVCSIR